MALDSETLTRHSLREPVAVVGCGYTGERLALRLAAAGVGVVVTARSAERVRQLEGHGLPAVAWRAGEPLPPAVAEARTVFVLHPPPEPWNPPAATDPDAALVYVSSTSVYGDADGAIVTESSPCAPLLPHAVARLAHESAYRALGARIVRAAGIYGPGRNIVERHREGRLRLPRHPERWVNLIHVDDLVALLLAAATHGKAGATYLAADGRPVPWFELGALAASVVGRPLPEASAGAGLFDDSRRCDPRETLTSLGVALTFPSALDWLARQA